MDRQDQFSAEEVKYLKLLSKRFPTIQTVSSEIINLRAILDLPKGTEHFMSDLHGEHEAFLHILNNCSGVIREKVDIVFGNSVFDDERASLATLIYYPEEKLEKIKEEVPNLHQWYRVTLHRLIEVCRWVSSKYTRSKVRKALPSDFAYIIDELLHTNYDARNKEQYYNKIIDTIVDIDRADAFIIALATLIKRLAVDHLHVVGDIFDRGPRADVIMDLLEQHHSVDIQWGNHDILWMGAAAGSEACIANVLNNSLKYANLDMIESGYGISLRPLVTFAQETYQGDCSCFTPKVSSQQKYNSNDIVLDSKLHKAIVVIQFKLEGQIIRRNPEYRMEDRLLLDKINYEAKTVRIGGVDYPIRDWDFPTIDPKDPYALTEREREVMDQLKSSFLHSEKLQRHVRFLYSAGALYKCYNSNLLYHGCIPMEEDGSFTKMEIGGQVVSGRGLMDQAEKMARNAFFSRFESPEKLKGQDFMWYMWCGPNSPLFGKDRMTTFERYLVEDKASWEEHKNPYYKYTVHGDACRRILEEFGLNPEVSHIVNGHVPVKTKDGENPVKADGKLIVIDGGFCRAYQKTTGIAGYTLIYNSYGMRLISHGPFTSVQQAIEDNQDILSTSKIFEVLDRRCTVEYTDTGAEIKEQIESLKKLLDAYRTGIIKEAEH